MKYRLMKEDNNITGRTRYYIEQSTEHGWQYVDGTITDCKIDAYSYYNKLTSSPSPTTKKVIREGMFRKSVHYRIVEETSNFKDHTRYYIEQFTEQGWQYVDGTITAYKEDAENWLKYYALKDNKIKEKKVLKEN